MVYYNYLLSDKVHHEIYTFYDHVSRKYCHTYSIELMHKNVNDAYDSIYKIENGLLRREPTIARWKGCYMGSADLSGWQELLIKNKVVPLHHGINPTTSCHPSGCADRQLQRCQF